MIKRIYRQLNPEGSILAAVIIMMFALSFIAISLLSFSTSQYSRTTRNTFSANAILVAEAGVEQTLYSMNQDDSFAGYATEQQFFSDNSQGRGVFTTEVINAASGNSKTIISTGKVYRKATDTTPISTRKVKVTIVGTGSEGYSVHTGPGGIILGGSANITNSDVYVNGTIALTGAARIGTASQPLNVNVANYSCPTGNNPGPTYPSLCSSTQPISLQHSTYIYGNVCATGQTSTGPNPSGNILPGNGGTGLVTGCTAPVVSTPTYDRNAQMSAVQTTAAGNSNTYVCNSWPFDRNWPANLRLTGNVTVGGSCNVVINGDVHITGNLTINGASRITVANSVGTDRPTVMVDGTISMNGSAQILANNQGTGIYFVSFRSSAACNPNCTTVTGTDLKTSQEATTVNIGGAVNLPGMIFHAYWGKLVLGGSGSIGSAVGQKIDMSGAGTITFGTALSSGEATWTVTSYQRLFE